MLRFIASFLAGLLVATGAAFAQPAPGPGPTSSPWIVNGPQIYYNGGCVMVPLTVTNGCEGAGSLNVQNLFAAGVRIPGINYGTNVQTALTQNLNGSGALVASLSPSIQNANLNTPSYINLINAINVPSGALPALTGDVTSSAGTAVTTVSKIQGTSVSGTTGSGAVVLASGATFSPTYIYAQYNGGAANFKSRVATDENVYILPGQHVSGAAGIQVTNDAGNSYTPLEINASSILLPGVTAPSLPTFGSSITPFYQTPVTTTATGTSGSPTITVTSAAGLSVGMDIDVSGAFGFPNGTQITAISGTTITASKNSGTTHGTPATIIFGVQRYDTNSSITTNTIAAINGFFGGATYGNSTWLYGLPGGSSAEYPQIATILSLGIGGQAAVFASKTSTVTSGLQAVINVGNYCYVDSEPAAWNTWCEYMQASTYASTVGYLLESELSIYNKWTLTREDPYQINNLGRVVNQRFDCGIGSSYETLGTGTECTAAIDIVPNPHTYWAAIIIGDGALDRTNTSNSMGQIIAAPINTGYVWYNSPGYPVWQIESTASTAVGTPKQLLLTDNDAIFGPGSQLSITGPAGSTTRNFNLYTNGHFRWQFSATSTAESGGNAGTDLAIARFDDTGTYIDIPLEIVRSTGNVYLNDVPAGTPVASLCLDSANKIIKKTTAGSCI